jgi:SSS family solute:Na+ symporter
MALGSALALFLYPHSVTGVLSASNRQAISRNAVFLPAYAVLLALIALLGFMALAAGVAKAPQFAPLIKQYGPNAAVPALFLAMFPSWFAGLAFAAIAIGALVPAAIMSIAASNLWTRNIYREFLRPECSAAQEAKMAKLVSLVIKFGALIFVLGLPLQYAIQLQLLGGVWIIQTLPAVIGGLYTRWFHDRALLLGWLAGIVAGTAMAASQQFKPIYPLHLVGWTIPCYAALASLVINFIVVVVLTPILNAMNADRGQDETKAAHYM